MEKKCCICGNIFTEKSYDAEPIRKGVCCTNCAMRFVFYVRARPDVHANKISSSSIVIFENTETEEKVMICCV